MSKKTEEAFSHAKDSLPGLKAISAVEVETGLAHGSLVVDEAFDLDAASAYNAEVLKAKIKAKNAMGMNKEKVELIMIELTSQLHLIQPTPSEKFLVYMAVDKSSSNMGIVRKTMKDVAEMIGKDLG